jgi:transposase
MSTAASASEPVSVLHVPLPDPEHLPDDLETLKRMVLELLVTLRQERQDKDALRHRLSLLLKRLYGPRSERFDPNQPLLFEEPLQGQVPQSGAAPPQATASESSRKKRKCRPHGRGPIPKDLPRTPVHHVLSEAERLCVCGEARVDIGADVSEQLEWKPASMFVLQHLVHKYVCPRCTKTNQTTQPVSPEPISAASMLPAEPVSQQPISAASVVPSETISVITGASIITAAKPAMPIDKGLPGPGLLAQVIVSKYFDHLPLHRQEHIFARQGVEISRSTTCDWMAACAELLRPLYDLMVTRVLQSQWLHTDDTSVKNLGHEPGSTALAHLWTYLGDREHPYNVFDFTLNRCRDGPAHFLKNYRGYLHADAFSGYDALYLPDPVDGVSSIIETACNAHARRKFYDARTSDDARSHQALAWYGQLYELERRAKENGFDDEARWQMRQQLSLPILEKFETWLRAERDAVLPKSPMAEAIGYALNNWSALCRYTEKGFLEIDNNVAEREMKRIAIGRKNWLFVGSPKGGHTAAVLYTFTSTCHRLKVEPWAYLKEVLTRMPATPLDQLTDLLPDRWQGARQVATPPTAAD